MSCDKTSSLRYFVSLFRTHPGHLDGTEIAERNHAESSNQVTEGCEVTGSP